MAIDQTGVPSIDASHGDFTGADMQNRIKGVDTPAISFGSAVDAVLREIETAATIIVDPVNRKVYGFDAASAPDSGDIAAPNATPLEPDAGQTGRSLTWAAGSDSGTGIPNKSSYTAVIATAKPTKTVSSLVGALLSAVPDATDPADVPLIVVDQVNGVVSLAKPTSRAATLSNLDAIVAGAAGSAVKIGLAVDPEASGETPLKFEGGAV